MFLGSSMTDSDIENRKIDIMLRVIKEDGSIKTLYI